ncbi:MAG: 50S ribosomal protein L29 [Bacteroides sp.]|nr:MAG: 50S ribosomal protein L29 [Bacteroides sp.]
MDINDLKKEIFQEQNNLIKLRLSNSNATLSNSSKIRYTKRNIARLKTLLNKKLKNNN